MDDKWFKNQQKRAGVTAEDIAAKMGRDRSAVSHIYTGKRRMSLEWAEVFADVLGVPVAEVLKRAGAVSEERSVELTHGFSDSDASPFVGKGREVERAKSMANALGGQRPGVDIWQVSSSSLCLMGYMPGDFILVDTHQSELCKAGDVVIAQKYNNKNGSASTILRRYEPPVLVAASSSPDDHRVDFVDGANVLIRGKVVASWRY